MGPPTEFKKKEVAPNEPDDLLDHYTYLFQDDDQAYSIFLDEAALISAIYTTVY